MPTHPSFEEQVRAYNEELRRYYAQGHPLSGDDVEKPSETVTEPPAPSPASAEDGAADVATDEAESEAEAEEPVIPDGASPPVERPWEALYADKWMEAILRQNEPVEAVWDEDAVPADAEAVTAAEEVPDEADSAEAPPFGNEPPQAVEDGGEPREGGNPADVGYLQVRVYSARGAVPIVDAAVSILHQNGDGGEELIHLSRTDESGSSPRISLPTVDRSLTLTPGVPSPFLNYTVQVNADGYVIIRNEGVTVYGGVTSVQVVPMIPLPEPQAEFESQIIIRPGGAPPELT